jgi:hypothetical protein
MRHRPTRSQKHHAFTHLPPILTHSPFHQLLLLALHSRQTRRTKEKRHTRDQEQLVRQRV